MLELDSPPSLRQFVTRRFARKGPPVSWVVFEPVGGVFAYVFARLGVSPSAVTLLGGVSGIAGAAVLGMAEDRGAVVLAAALLALAFALDCADGQLARATGRASAQGAWLDVAVDASVTACLAASLSYALSADGTPAPWGFLLAGAFGGSRTADLLTWMTVRGTKRGGMQLGTVGSLVKTAFTAAVDTPFVYAVLCATRLWPSVFRLVLIAVTLLTLARMLVMAARAFRAERPEPTG